MEADLVSYLLAGSPNALVDLIGNRLYAEAFQQKTEFPAIAYSSENEEPQRLLDGGNGLHKRGVLFVIAAETAAVADSVAEALDDLMDNMRTGGSLRGANRSDKRTDKDQNANLFIIEANYDVHYV